MCLWEQLVLTLSKQSVCLMKDTNVTRCSASENLCKFYPPERNSPKPTNHHLTLKEEPKVKSDHIKRFLAHDF